MSSPRDVIRTEAGTAGSEISWQMISTPLLSEYHAIASSHIEELEHGECILGGRIVVAPALALVLGCRDVDPPCAGVRVALDVLREERTVGSPPDVMALSRLF